MNLSKQQTTQPSEKSMTIINTEYLAFNQHTKQVQEKILDKMRDINVDFEWWDATTDHTTEVLNSIGFDNVLIYFSGFYSQGDGAQFIGNYSFNGKQLAKIKKSYPKWLELHNFVRRLEIITSKKIDLTFEIESYGNYSHENCTSFTFHLDSHKELKQEQEEVITEACRGFMKEIYSTLESEYDYLTSDEAVKESIECNEYEFDSEGNLL